jgi:rare lipoprotein A (peptidoglycan hydrolase)
VTAVKIVLPDAKDVAALAEKYDLKYHAEGTSITSEELLSLMRALDTKLATEEHEASLYSEKFHGKGTAFGETFDMYALTAAHRTFPYNTLVKVTNTQNGKSVIVRINDRGPYVKGRDMDLSLAAFTTIAERSQGKIRATFERLGDVNLGWNGLATTSVTGISWIWASL